MGAPIVVNLPVMMYWESLLKAQSHTQRCEFSLSSVIREKSAVLQICTVQSAEVVASNLMEENWDVNC